MKHNWMYAVLGACSYVDSYGAMLQAGRSRVGFPTRSMNFVNMALGLTRPVTEMSTRNRPGGIKCGRPVRLTTLSASLNRLSTKCGISEVSLQYGPPRPTTGVVLLLFILYNIYRESERGYIVLKYLLIVDTYRRLESHLMTT
jgi:hypothetical protein